MHGHTNIKLIFMLFDTASCANFVKAFLFWLKSEKKNVDCLRRMCAYHVELLDQSVLVCMAWRLLGFGWRRRTADMESSCVYIELRVSDNQKGVVLQFGVEGDFNSTSSYKNKYITGKRRLTTGIRPEKCVFRRFLRRVNVYLHKPR